MMDNKQNLSIEEQFALCNKILQKQNIINYDIKIGKIDSF